MKNTALALAMILACAAHSPAQAETDAHLGRDTSGYSCGGERDGGVISGDLADIIIGPSEHANQKNSSFKL